MSTRGRTVHWAVCAAAFALVFALVAGVAAGQSPPGNDGFAAARPLAGEAGEETFTNAGATAEPDEPQHAGTPGGASVWFSWRAPAGGLYSFDTAGSEFDTLLAVYTGAAVGVLTATAANDDAGLSEASRVTFVAEKGTTYLVAVDGFLGETGAGVLRWAPLVPPPNDDFGGALELAGARGSVSSSNLAATKQAGEPDHAGDAGGSSVWFTWTAPKDGEQILDTIGSDFDTLLAVYTGNDVGALDEVASDDQSGAAGASALRFLAEEGVTYHIAVDGFFEERGSVQLNWAPDLRHFRNAEAVTGETGAVTVTNDGAGKETGEPDHAGNEGGASVWFDWVAPSSRTFSFATEGSGIDTLLAVYTGAGVDGLTTVAADDASGPAATSRVIFDAEAGTRYRIAVDGYFGEQGPIVLSWEPAVPPANDAFGDAQALAGEAGTVLASNRYAGKQAGEPDHAGNPGGASVWFRWVAPGSGEVTFVIRDTEVDTLLAAYTGAGVGQLTEVAADDDAGAGRASRVTFPVEAGVTYHLAVDGFFGDPGASLPSTGAFELAWAVAPAGA